MTTCTGCEAEMAAEAKTCPHCEADQRSWFGRRRKLIATTFLLCLGLGLAGALYLQPTGTPLPPLDPQFIAESTQIAQSSASGVYYNCGQIVVEPVGYFKEDLSLVRARETCLWQRYRAGQRGMLRVELDGTDAFRLNLFTVDPTDQATPIHDEITATGLGARATCRAMLNTATGLQMEGCSGDTAGFGGLNDTVGTMQYVMHKAQQCAQAHGQLIYC